jgi:CHAT domain-containing protein
VILVTRTSLRVLSVPDAETLDPKITFFRSLLERRDGSDRAGGRVLHDLLVRPLLDALPESIDSLVVVPDGPLSRLPLDALPLGSSSGYLAERLQVSVVPSVAVWLRLRRTRPDRSGSSALAVAVPEHPGMDPLPHAAEEARRALRAFPAPGQLLLGAAATRSAVLGTDLAPFGLLHLATHSVADTLHPERSAIALGGPTGDDELQVEDISGLSLDGQAVVLASCNTLSGPVRRAEGVISLARPFLAAGAQAVVGSIEVLGDTASTRLFDRFYAGIERGETVGHALAASKRRMIASGAPAAAWSGVVLVGNSAAAPREGRSSSSRSLALWLGLAAVLLASALLVVRRAVARR